MTYIIDTHTLLWYLTDARQLSKKARSIINNAQQNNLTLVIPTIVLLEALYVIEKGRVKYKTNKFLEEVSNPERFIIQPLDWDTITEFVKIKKDIEIHDRAIIATAKIWSAFILTKDQEIKKYYPEKVVW